MGARSRARQNRAEKLALDGYVHAKNTVAPLLKALEIGPRGKSFQVLLKQHTATHYNTLQHTATHRNTLQHTATHCSTLQPTATLCNTRGKSMQVVLK